MIKNPDGKVRMSELSMHKNPYNLTIKEAAAAIANGALTVSQLTEACLERIDALEDKIQAWTLVDRQGAMMAANRLDSELQQGGRRGPLLGIPFGIKDIFYTSGLRTEAGSATLSGFVPAYDATSVADLKKAGAIILGKTQTTQFAFSDPAPTRNPWNIDHTPGGSSSGSAAAVAAGMCLAALGSQTLGSVLRPAAYNGIVGLKPSYGRISTFGVVPSSWTLDHVGILARSVEDAAYVYQAIAGYDPMDGRSMDEAVPDCLSGLESSEHPRLGLAKQYFFDHADEEMRRHCEDVVLHLRNAGATVVEVELPPGFSEIEANGRAIMAVENAAYHKDMFATYRSQYRNGIRELIETGLNITATDYAQRLQIRIRHRVEARSLLSGLDAIVTPGATGAAPKGLDSTGSPVMQAPWTVVGVPSMSLPTGISRRGLPLAIQLAGRPNGEKALLATARWCERALDIHLSPTHL